MYILFRDHNVLPDAYVNLGFGGRTVLKAFIRYEAEERRREEGQKDR